MYSKKATREGYFMSTTRQDAWNQDEDLLLAEVVLRHIREGSTQLQAFEEVGRKLSRTAAACGFRWNSYVRKQYKAGIELAKKQRKEYKKQALEVEEYDIPPKESINNTIDNKITIQEVITFLERFDKSQEANLSTIEQENKHLKDTIAKIKEELSVLQQENETLKNNLQVIEEDYKALIEIMERARKMVVFQEDERSKKVKFQMDKNGNLERVEK